MSKKCEPCALCGDKPKHTGGILAHPGLCELEHYKINTQKSRAGKAARASGVMRWRKNWKRKAKK